MRMMARINQIAPGVFEAAYSVESDAAVTVGSEAVGGRRFHSRDDAQDWIEESAAALSIQRVWFEESD